MKKVAILQSNYIPWKGYFDMINMVDEFVLYDDMQCTKRDWRNRNIIKTFQGMQWISIPVATKGKFYQKINETEVISSEWVDEHWKTLQYNYARAKHFDEYSETIKELYEKCREEKYLSRINYIFLKSICEILDINTKITWSSEYNLIDGKTEKLVGICKQAGADCYLSGPAAKDYIENELFANESIALEYMDYSGYKEYSQLHGEFLHSVTILDMIFNLGKETKNFMKSF